MNFTLLQQHGWSLTELEDMVPWERDIYIAQLRNFLAEEAKKIKEE